MDAAALQPPSLGPAPQLDWNTPDLTQLALVPDTLQSALEYRLFRLLEISQDQPQAYRHAFANVFSSLSDSDCAAVYILSGRPEAIELYLGVAAQSAEADAFQASKLFKSGFEGNFLGAQLEEVRDDAPQLRQALASSRYFGLMTGVPSFNQAQPQHEQDDFQGTERLANSLLGAVWQLVIVARPASDAQLCHTLEQLYELSSELSEHIKYSLQRSDSNGYQITETNGDSESSTEGSSSGETRGKSISASKGENGNSTTKSTSDSSNESQSTGLSRSLTKGSSYSKAQGENRSHGITLSSERMNKRMEGIFKQISETLIERFLRGRSKGMYHTAVYVCAETQTTYKRLTRAAIATFQGNHSAFTPLQVHDLPFKTRQLGQLLQLYHYTRPPLAEQQALIHSLPLSPPTQLIGATWLNSAELALIAGLPARELPGLKIRTSVDFALNANPPHSDSSALKLGQIIQHGRVLTHSSVLLSKADLRKHIFVTGVTGAGKTTTCLKLLLESNLPFLVIEPAKTEYRALYAHGVEVEYYCLGREDLTPFRLNPFELVSAHQSLASHIDMLKATFAAVFPMEAAMPQIVEEAIIKAYQSKGWLIHENENLLSEDPWQADSEVWPCVADLITELDQVIKSKGMGREFEEKYRGSLVARLTNLTLGVKGRMLNTRRSLNISQLLDKRVVIELEELKDEQDKALFMGLIITRLAECIKQRHRQQPDFQHLTLIEEAHRLLARPELGESGARKMGVEMFANLLAEVRKYGAGLIIADQIPNKLLVDVIKNTNTKLVHRLFAADDRNTIGDAMGLSDAQKEFLPRLQPGESIIYCGGWHGAVRLKITAELHTSQPELAEYQLQQLGQQQLWAQRHYLLPHLARYAPIQTAAQLTQFLRAALVLSNLLLQLNPLRPVLASTALRERLRQRWLTKYSLCVQQHALERAQLVHGLVQVFRDCALNSRLHSTEDYQLLEADFNGALVALDESLTAFDHFVHSLHCGEGFDTLRLLDSL